MQTMTNRLADMLRECVDAQRHQAICAYDEQRAADDRYTAAFIAAKELLDEYEAKRHQSQT